MLLCQSTAAREFFFFFFFFFNSFIGILLRYNSSKLARSYFGIFARFADVSSRPVWFLFDVAMPGNQLNDLILNLSNRKDPSPCFVVFFFVEGEIAEIGLDNVITEAVSFAAFNRIN